MILAVLLLSLIVFTVDVRVTKSNMNISGNGFGAVRAVAAGEAVVPAAYRVFVPWLCSIFGAQSPIVYLWVKFAGILFAFCSSWLLFSVMGAGPLMGVILLAVYFLWAALFDYADSYWEIGFFAIAFWLMAVKVPFFWGLLCVVTFLATLNRETGLFIPIVAALDGEWYLAALLMVPVAGGFLIPRLHYGPRERYCPFNLLSTNWQTMREKFRNISIILLEEYFHFLVVAGLVVYAAFHARAAYEWGMLLLFPVLLVPTMWREIRVFAPCMLGVIPCLLR